MIVGNKHLISDWEQLRNIKDIEINHNYYGLIVSSFRTDDFIGKTVEIVRYKYQHKSEYTVLYSFIVESQKLMNNTVIVMNRQEILNIIN